MAVSIFAKEFCERSHVQKYTCNCGCIYRDCCENFKKASKPSKKKILDDEELNIVIGNLNGGGDPLNGGDINPKCTDCPDVVVFCSPITQVNYDIHFKRRNEGKSILLCLADILTTIQSHLNWSRFTKRRKLKYFQELLTKQNSFDEMIYLQCEHEDSCFITNRASIYLMNDIYLKEDFKGNEIINLMYNMLTGDYFTKVTSIQSNRENIETYQKDKRTPSVLTGPLSTSTPLKSTPKFDVLVSHKPNSSSSFTFEDSLANKVTSLTLPPSNKVLPPLDLSYDYIIQSKKRLKIKDKFKIQELLHDCTRLGLITSEQISWYVKLIENIGLIAPELLKLMDMELKDATRRMNEDELSHRQFSLLDEYRSQTSWAIKLLIESITKDKTWIAGTPEKRIQHDLRKVRKIYFTTEVLFHIHNSLYSGPLQKQLSDNMYMKHTDVNYLYNLLSHLGVMESLTTVTERQKTTSEQRNMKKEILEAGKETYCHIHDNFNKVHITGDPVFGCPQTKQNEILNRTLLILPPTTNCKSCIGKCSCRWTSETPPNQISFESIFLSDIESKEKDKFEETRLFEGLKVSAKLYHLLKSLESINDDEIEDILQASGNSSIEEDEKESDSSSRTEGSVQHSGDVIELEENAEETNAYKVNIVEMTAEEVNEGETKQGEKADETYVEEVHMALNEEEILDKLKKRILSKKEARGDHKPSILEDPDFHVKKIILTAIAGTDTDAGLAKAILNEAKKLCLEDKDQDERMFVGGDQKTIGVILTLMRQWAKELKPFYVILPDLHYRKSMLHATLIKYSSLGVEHLAKLSGYLTGTTLLMGQPFPSRLDS